MANVEHRNLTGADLHEPKGAASAGAGKVYVANGAGSGAWTLPYELIGILEDQKSSGTGGGSFNSGADRTRTLNTEYYDKYSTIALASNQFTITPNGSQTFVIEWSCPAFDVGVHQSLLRQTSGVAADVKRGTVEGLETDTGTTSGHDHSYQGQTRSHGVAVVTISAATTYEIRHRGTNSGSFGQEGGFGTEVYTTVKIYRTG